MYTYIHNLLTSMHSYSSYIPYILTYIEKNSTYGIHTLILSYIHAYIHTYISLYIYTYIGILHTYIHTYIHYILPQFSQATEEKAEELIALIDVEGKGTINFAEFCKFIVLLKQGDARLPQSVCMYEKETYVCMYVCM